MIFVWTFLVAAVAVSNVGAIYGGEPTTIREHTSMMQVEERYLPFLWRYVCIANILTPTTAISSASCFDGLLQIVANIRVRAGATETGTGGTIRAVSQKIEHPDYQDRDLFNNLVVLRLQVRLDLGATIGLGSIPPPNMAAIPNGLNMTTAGWGATMPSLLPGTHADTLHAVTVQSIDQQICTTRYQQLFLPRIINNENLCFGLLDQGGVGCCDGDEGAPVVYQGIIMCIHSWGYQCGHPQLYDVCTRLSYHSAWIQANAS